MKQMNTKIISGNVEYECAVNATRSSLKDVTFKRLTDLSGDISMRG